MDRVEIDKVIEEEFDKIQRRRERKGHPFYDRSDESPVGSGSQSAGTSADKDKRRCKTLIGLALSGGGIRSAATNLGVLQGLSEKCTLPWVDYLSTVSGGGYIGACLSSLLSNTSEPGRPEFDQYSFEGDTRAALFSTEWKNFPLREDKYEEQGDNKLGRLQMGHIRTMASYLAPRARHFSENVMKALGSVFISTFMSLLWFTLVVTAITSVYMLVVATTAPDIKAPEPGAVTERIESRVDGRSGLIRLSLEKSQRDKTRAETIAESKKIIAAYAALPFSEFKDLISSRLLAYSLLGLVLWSIFFHHWFKRNFCRKGKSDPWTYRSYSCLWMLALIMPTLVLGLSAFLAVYFKYPELTQGAILLVPALFTAATLISCLVSYVITAKCDDWTRENRSRLHALAGVLCAVLLLTLILAMLPGFMRIGRENYNALLIIALGAVIRYALAGKDKKQPPGKKSFALPDKYKEWLLGTGALLFFFLAVVLAGNLINEFVLLNKWPGTVNGIWANKELLIFTGGIIALLLLFHWQVDVNKISPHYFYRDRLAEAFLRTNIRDNYYLRDDAEMKLAKLHGDKGGECAARGPYLLMNATLNLTASHDLKSFNRKADIFTFSSLFVGSEKTGFIKTKDYRVDDGELKLARAMAISGAAVTSVMGMNSSLARSFACTIFGVRLGYWLPNFKNPEIYSLLTEIEDKEFTEIEEKEASKDDREKNEKEIKALTEQLVKKNWKRLYNELVGSTTAQDQEIYLSDGGHSGDNLGMIPLLQRRVKVLIVSDSECDPNHSFASFNSSLRNAYVDEGIQIKISLKGLRKNSEGVTRDKFAVGRIIYPEQDKDQKNWLVLLKNTITDKEVTSILYYKEKSSAFPHESTGDQFFTEEQFESYRALGRFAVVEAWESRESWLRACRKSAPYNTEILDDLYRLYLELENARGESGEKIARNYTA